MKAAAGWFYALAMLAAVGAAIGGIALMMQTDCVPNPYNGVFGTDLCSGHTHPFAAAGVGVLIGGLINAAVVGTVGYLCSVVSDLRDYRDADAAVVLEQAAADEAQPPYTGPAPEAQPWGLYGSKG